MKIIIYIIFILLFLYLYFRYETFKSEPFINEAKTVLDFPCQNLGKITNIKYTELTQNELKMLRDGMNKLRVNRITYQCPDPTKKSTTSLVGGIPKTIPPPLISGSQYGFNPDSVRKLLGGMTPSLVKKIQPKDKNSKLVTVSNIDMIPILIAIVKQLKMGNTEALYARSDIEQNIQKQKTQIREIESWTNKQLTPTRDELNQKIADLEAELSRYKKN